MPYSTVYETPGIGKLVVASDGESIVGAWFEGQKRFGEHAGGELVPEPAGGVPVLALAREWLDRYFAGDPLPVSALPLAPKGTPFQQRVWARLCEIPYGQTRTYAHVAAELEHEDGRRHGARAVGAANGRNPISLIVPCHRLVGSGGSLTGYAGGIERKVWLLRHEHADMRGLYVPKRGTAL